MVVYAVTVKSQEESPTGIILRVTVGVMGVYSSRAFADAIAAKYNGTVSTFIVDQECRNDVESWNNPGYLSR